MFEQQSLTAKDRDRAKALKTLLGANARWNATRRDASENDIRRLVDETSTKNPDLRTELLYSWEKGFIDKPTEEGYAESPILLRKDENGKSGKALKNPLKGRVMAPTPSTVSTAAGSIYKKKRHCYIKDQVTPKDNKESETISGGLKEKRTKQGGTSE